MAVNGSVSKDTVDEEEMSAEGAVEDDVDDDVDDLDRRLPNRPISTSTKRRRLLPIVLIGGVVVAAVAVTAVLIVNRKPAYRTLVDRKAGFSLRYPSSWTVTPPKDPNVPLLASFGGGGLDTLLVRVLPIEASVDTTNVANIQSVTDAIISGTKVNVSKHESLTVNGLPGYWYFYSLPKDPSSGVTLVHSRFFVFPPHQMISLTFQTLEPDLPSLADSIARVMSSFHAVPSK